MFACIQVEKPSFGLQCIRSFRAVCFLYFFGLMTSIKSGRAKLLVACIVIRWEPFGPEFCTALRPCCIYTARNKQEVAYLTNRFCSYFFVQKYYYYTILIYDMREHDNDMWTNAHRSTHTIYTATCNLFGFSALDYDFIVTSIISIVARIYIFDVVASQPLDLYFSSSIFIVLLWMFPFSTSTASSSFSSVEMWCLSSFE